jgi:single-stranded-DNA-specific exonuclease
MTFDLFKEQLKEAALFFNSFNKSKQIKIISHHDADGICSAALLIKLFSKLKINYNLSIVSTLNSNKVLEFSREEYEYYVFCDLGSSYINIINNSFDDKKVLILDHHIIKENKINKNIFHVNPYLCSIDASNEISGAGVVYLFSELIDKSMIDYCYLAIVGAIGDCQDKRGFFGINTLLLKKAIDNNLISHIKGIKIMGAYSKPIVKFLRQSIDPFIPGISENETAVIKFLKLINIEPKINNKFRMLSDLTDDEKSRLIVELSKIIPKSKKKNLFGDVYLINFENGPYKDIREFSTILNSCGRLDKSTIGIGACLNDAKMKKKALEILNDYKKEILDIISWFNKNRNSNLIKESNNYIIINFKGFVMPSMAGIFASIVSYSNFIDKNKFILTMSRNEDDSTKISLRYSRNSINSNINLYEILSKIVLSIDGEFGGHKNAAGAIIKTQFEEKFIQNAINYFNKLSLEEKID